MKVIKMANFFGLTFFSQTKAVLLDAIHDSFTQKVKAGAKPPLLIFTPNPEQVVIASQDLVFQNMLKQADFLLPDGAGVVVASRILHVLGKIRGKTVQSLPERITGIEVAQSLLKKYKDEEMILVGGKGYQSVVKSPKLENSMRLSIQGKSLVWFTGYQSVGFASGEDERKLRIVLRKVKPSVVFVAFGAPEQEKWILDHVGLLQQEGVKLAMAVGGSFDVLTGKLKRAPHFWQKLGFEWLFRLIQEPNRWRRQLRLFSFVGLTIKASWKMLLGK